MKIINLCALLSCSVAFAGNIPGAVTITPADAYYHFNNKRHLENSAYPNLSIGYNFTQHWAMEFTGGVLNTQQHHYSDEDHSLHGTLFMIDGIYRFAQWSHFEPYVLGGIGLLTLDQYNNDSTHPGNINAGLGAQLFWGPAIAMRLDARDVYQMTGNSYNDYMVNFGVSFLFGGTHNYK